MNPSLGCDRSGVDVVVAERPRNYRRLMASGTAARARTAAAGAVQRDAGQLTSPADVIVHTQLRCTSGAKMNVHIPQRLPIVVKHGLAPQRTFVWFPRNTGVSANLQGSSNVRAKTYSHASQR